MAEGHSTYTLKDDGGIGTVKIADEVIAVIAGLAATEVKGVASIAGGITNAAVARKGIKALSKGVKIAVDDGSVSIDMVISLDYGYSIPDTGKAVQEKVKSAVENMTGMKVTVVNVRVDGIKEVQG
ncbi:MAG: Asp23/Gls24 family envelope stress response protein [Lachnospiraceae bacterium]|nr:Asp23/Gls24 family envelope stress response protein [Lachnospiraceae bacterium]